MKSIELNNQLKSNLIYDNKINIVLISNITLEPYFNNTIKDFFNKINISVSIQYINYDEYQSNEFQRKIFKADIIIICLNFDFLYPNVFNDILSNKLNYSLLFTNIINQCRKLYRHLKSQSNSHIIWFGFEDYCYNYNYFNGNVSINDNLVDNINKEIEKALKNQDTYIDLKHLIANVGLKDSYDNKGKYRWNSVYNQKLVIQICYEIYKQYLIQNGISKKCLILDCDNVLWGGTLSEDGIENINLGNIGLGRSFQDFQRYLLTLYYHGVILTVCSKNDLSNVMQMFNKHSEMILKEEHIACFQVNWSNKTDNIKKIAETLNIGLNSIVFIDDSDFEIESVKLLLPEVTTIKYKRDTVYEHLSCFNLRTSIDIEKVKERNNTFKTNPQRQLLMNKHQSFEEYLQALNMNIEMHVSLPIEYKRIVELSQRVNKCTNGRRYTIEELKDQLKNEKYKLYSIFISDKFSDLGLVGAFGIDDNILDLFSLSCRALGRKVENKMKEYIYTNFDIKNVVFFNTPNNGDMNKFLNL